MNANKKSKQKASFKVLHARHPQKVGDCFVQVRMWETADDDHVELIAEYGEMDASGDIVTRCQVMPFFMTVPEVLQVIGQ